jgi:large subunit ribosomal protein L10
MAITKEKKNEIKEKLEDIAQKSSSVVFANFHGLDISKTTDMRRGLQEKGVEYYVAKKSLIELAFKDQNIEGEMPELEGEIALAYSDDSLAPAREVQNYAKKHKKNLALVGGVFDREFQSRDAIVEIASIPSIDGLRGMFANVINSPIQNMAIVLNQVAEKRS